MISLEMIKKIENLVHEKPRSIQELSQLIGKNWRTVDRYVKKIEEDFGTISTRIFREGTRGALKVIYWNPVEFTSKNVFQKSLEKEIMKGRFKEDFSPFDIFQHVNEKNKQATLCKNKNEEEEQVLVLKEILEKAKKEVLIFSGNLSTIKVKDNSISFLNMVEDLVNRGVKVRILSRVDIGGKENIQKFLSINFKMGKENIEIKHAEQPLRGYVVDSKIIRLKEVREPRGRDKELKKRIVIYYTLISKEWAEWMRKIFYKIFNESVGSSKRMDELNKLDF
ncbi:MAG: hypothetical protein ABIF88_01115 [archaeon]